MAAAIFCCLISSTFELCSRKRIMLAAREFKARRGGGKADEKSALPPLPPEAHVQQSIQLDGKTLHYTVTVGALPVRDKDGKVAGRWC